MAVDMCLFWRVPIDAVETRILPLAERGFIQLCGGGSCYAWGGSIENAGGV